MADRTQAPSGAGYALENRQVVARAFPTQFRQLGVQSLTGYFQTLLQTLKRQAPTTAGEPPLIVLRGDRSLDYGRVMQVMGELGRAGFTSISLVTDGSVSAP